MVRLTACWMGRSAVVSTGLAARTWSDLQPVGRGQKHGCQHWACSKNMIGLTSCWTRAKVWLSAPGLQQEHGQTYMLLDKGKSGVVSTRLATRTWSDLQPVGGEEGKSAV